MVYVNSQKFACASCIKGHRSSSCHHTNRPLFEIKKKGRPVSQCEKCRELRKNKRMHVKCSCASIEVPEITGRAPEVSGISAAPVPTTPRRPAQRKPPANPTLPHGLKDLWPQNPSPSLVEANPKQRVDALLNPCNCKSLFKCDCPHRAQRSSVDTIPVLDSHAPSTLSPIMPLVKSCCAGGTTNSVDLVLASNDPSIACKTKIPTPSATAHRKQRHVINMPYVCSSHTQTARVTVPTSALRDTYDEHDDAFMGLDLPPLRFSSVGGSAPRDETLRTLPSFRNFDVSEADSANTDAVASLTRCGCGSTCTCPACREHRGTEIAALSGEDCPDGCGSCVDHMGRLALPTPCSTTLPSFTSNTSSYSAPAGAQSRPHGHVERPSSGMSTLDHFYAIAALLPPPPPSSHTMGPGTLDPTNVAIYRQPSEKGVQKQDWQKAAGLVQIPPLNCCSGRCKCPGGVCGCGSECNGGCGRHDAGAGNAKGKGRENATAKYESAGKEGRGVRPMGGCCAVKKAPASVEGTTTSTRSMLRL